MKLENLPRLLRGQNLFFVFSIFNRWVLAWLLLTDNARTEPDFRLGKNYRVSVSVDCICSVSQSVSQSVSHPRTEGQEKFLPCFVSCRVLTSTSSVSLPPALEHTTDVTLHIV